METIAISGAEFCQPSIDQEMDDLIEMLKQTKKKRSKPEKLKKKEVTESKTNERDIYASLLTRLYEQVHTQKPHGFAESKKHLPPPQVARVGTSRILWTNFAEICQILNREQSHVSNYFFTELGSTGSLTQQQQLLIKGKFVPKYILSVLRKYIIEYALCQMCRGMDTKLTRDSHARIDVLHCETCQASRAVAAIQKGYSAIKSGERRAARNGLV